MAPRKPRLDWIKEVLADLEDVGERARPASLGVGLYLGAVSADFQLANDQLNDRAKKDRAKCDGSKNDCPENDRIESLEGDDRVFCQSWQLMRLTAAREG